MTTSTTFSFFHTWILDNTQIHKSFTCVYVRERGKERGGAIVEKIMMRKEEE